MRISRIKYGILTLFATLIMIMSCNEEKKETDLNEQDEMATEVIDDEEEKQRLEAEAKIEKEKIEARENSITTKAMANTETKTLVTALKAAELDVMMAEPGNYTVFAPTENAFSKLPEGQLDELLKPENKEKLKSILQYHVVPGKIMSDKLVAAIKSGNGKYTFNTVTGQPLTAMMSGDQIVIEDGSGQKAHVVQGNVDASNGVVHLIDHVMMAKK